MAVIAAVLIGVAAGGLASASGAGSSTPDPSGGAYQAGYQNAYQSGLQLVQSYGTSGLAAGQASDATCEQQMVYSYSGQALQDADAGCRQAASDLANRYP